MFKFEQFCGSLHFPCESINKFKPLCFGKFFDINIRNTKTVIKSDSIVQWSAESGRASKIDAESLPFIRPLFDCQNAWFGGDFTSIPGFRIESFSGRRLALSAVDGVAGSMFSRIEIDFSEDFTKVRRVRMAEKTGDEMVLTFDKTANNVELPPSTWECP